MTGYERILSALRGEQPDQVPVMLHNFMHAAREFGVTMADFRRSAKVIADSFIASVEKYGYDGIVVDIDTATLAGALGAHVDFPEDQPARSMRGCLEKLEDVRDFHPPDVLKYPVVRVWLEAVRTLRDYFGNEILVRGNCDQSPFSLAALTRSITPWMLDLLDLRRRDLVHLLLDRCASVSSRFIRLMAEAGAHVISTGDSLAGPVMISPAMYRKFALPYQKRVCQTAHELRLPYILHICGKTGTILPDMVETGADGFEVDHKTDARAAESCFRGRATFIGNLDPSGVLALGDPKLVERKTRELLSVFSDNPRFILNSGCAIPPNAPEANIRAMIRTARSAYI